MKIYDFEQGTEEWHKIRLGKITASKFDILTGKTFGKTVYNYAYEIVAEIITGQWKEVSAKQMEWGSENEPYARKAYKMLTFNNAKEIGFIEHDDMIGCSPDGIIGDEGLIEIKCPWNSSNHVISLAKKEIPLIYKAQVQGQLWISERKWCDFVSYDPRVKDDFKKIILIRVNRDEEYIEFLKEKVFKFKKIVQDICYNIMDKKLLKE